MRTVVQWFWIVVCLVTQAIGLGFFFVADFADRQSAKWGRDKGERAAKC